VAVKKHEGEEPVVQVEKVVDSDAEQVFVEGVLARREAAKPVDGELPAGATHEIVEDDREGAPPKIRRTRFKAY
jgi:hypothetical protein